MFKEEDLGLRHGRIDRVLDSLRIICSAIACRTCAASAQEVTRVEVVVLWL